MTCDLSPLDRLSSSERGKSNVPAPYGLKPLRPSIITSKFVSHEIHLMNIFFLTIEVDKIREYIINNPLKWLLDRENPDRQGSEQLEDEIFKIKALK